MEHIQLYIPENGPVPVFLPANDSSHAPGTAVKRQTFSTLFHLSLSQRKLSQTLSMEGKARSKKHPSLTASPCLPELNWLHGCHSKSVVMTGHALYSPNPIGTQNTRPLKTWPGHSSCCSRKFWYLMWTKCSSFLTLRPSAVQNNCTPDKIWENFSFFFLKFIQCLMSHVITIWNEMFLSNWESVVKSGDHLHQRASDPRRVTPKSRQGVVAVTRVQLTQASGDTLNLDCEKQKNFVWFLLLCGAFPLMLAYG